MANPGEIIGWGAVMSATTGVVIKLADIWLARRNKETEEESKARGLAIEARKSEDEADAKLIAALMEERKAYQEEIRTLRAEVAQERTRCDEELRKLREHFELQIANERQIYNAQIEALRTEIRGLIGEVASLKSENQQLRREVKERR